MIYGYAAKASLWPGERLLLHVSCSVARFRVVLYRWIGKLERMLATSWLNGKRAGARGADENWEWPQYDVALPTDLPSGVYIAHLQGRDSADAHIAMTEATVLFVVRAKMRGRLLYKLPLSSYNAYNRAGGACYDDKPPQSLEPPGAKLSFQRPGLGIGGPTFGADDFYDRSSPRHTFAHWDARFVGWLLRMGYTPEFCTDLDIHHDPALLHGYRLMLSGGHDEYWSTPMRDGVEHFVAHGGNAAFFSARVCCWRVHLVDDGTAMVCHQGGPNGARDHWWHSSGAARPEDALSGASHRHGGAWRHGRRDSLGYTVQDPNHWIFNDTGLVRGQCFGEQSSPPLVGHACDGAPLASFDVESGNARLSPMAGDGGTPGGYQLLAACPLNEQWQARVPAKGQAAAGAMHAATMGIFTRGGTVFQAGTTDWAQVLASGQDQQVETITRNVIDGLLRANRGAV